MILPRETTSARRINSLIEEALRDEADRLPIARDRWKHLFAEERDTLVEPAPAERPPPGASYPR